MTERPVVRRSHIMLACVLAIAVLAPGWAGADTTAARVSRRGACSGPSVWKLSVARDAGRLTIRFLVRGGKADQRWNVFISDNGERVFTGSRISGAGGYFAVRADTRDRAGRDRIKASAVNTVSGESCRGRAAI
ncbi:MAG: hypothetical protein WD739_06860 [Actinomycetota bacterium]